jgi:putative methionine-R-sulfoxide reductase with GAF domain
VKEGRELIESGFPDFFTHFHTFTLSHFHTCHYLPIIVYGRRPYPHPGPDRAERYQELLPQIEGVISAESDLIANLANVAAILKEGLGFFWVGFYRMMEGELVLGPFQGPLACTRIALDRGVCGACATQRKTLIGDEPGALF